MPNMLVALNAKDEESNIKCGEEEGDVCVNCRFMSRPYYL